MKRFDSFEVIKVAQEILNSKCAIVKTDTVMGIISLSFTQIAKIKQRELNKNQVLFINNTNPFVPLKNKLLKKLINSFWPGELTVIVDGVSYRMPNSPFLLNLISLTGNLYSSSANIAGQEVVYDFDELEKVFGEYDDNIILVDDKEVADSKIPSTIIDVDNAQIIREGTITETEIFGKIMKKYHLKKPN